MNLLLLLFFSLSVSTSAKVVERIVAIVNSEIITLSDIAAFKKKVKSGGLVDDSLLKMTSAKKLEKDPGALVEHLINERLIDSEIKRQNLTVTIERVEKEIRSIAKKNKITRTQLMEALKSQGASVSEYQDFIKTTLERQALIEKEITSRIKISEDEITEYFLKHSGGRTSEQYYDYTIAHMIFLGQNGGAKAARKRGEKVLGMLADGKSFDNLASQFSEDPNFTQGGLLGSFKVNELNPKLRNTVSKLDIGQHSSVIDIGGGNFQIIKIVKKKVIPNPELDAQKGRISEILFEAAFKKQLGDWLARKRQESFIRINQAS